VKNRLSSYQPKSSKTEVKYDVSCYGCRSVREECSGLKLCEKRVMKTCGQRVWKYEEAAEDCIKKS
jgi:hypothetical protein